MRNFGTTSDRLLGGTFSSSDRLEIHTITIEGESLECGKPRPASRLGLEKPSTSNPPEFQRLLGEDEDWLRDVADEMEIQDGAIWVYGVGEDGVQAFTYFGIENLIELVRMYKENPTWLKRWQPE